MTIQLAEAKMIADVPIISSDWTIKKAKSYFEKNISSFESIRYLYILDDERKLTGILSLKQLLSNTSETKKISEIYEDKRLITVRPDTPEGKVAYLALKYNIKAVPVLNENSTFLGVVPSDKILSIVYHEARSTLMRFAGVNTQSVHFDSIMTTPFITAFNHRIPWLVLGTFGGLFSAQIIKSYEGVLGENLILASFIPLIVYISDAVRHQMEAFMIRELALEEKFVFIQYFIKQLALTLLVGLTCGTILFLFVAIFQSNAMLGAAIGLSVLCASASGTLTGVLIPYVVSKAKVDPAYASGPLATILQDIISVVIYFTIASILLG